MFISDRRFYLSNDHSRVVEESDPDAAFLLVGAGGTLDDATARKYGLTSAPLVASALPAAPASESSPEAGATPTEEKAEELPEHKAVGPGDNKAIFPAANPRTKKRVRRDG